MIPDTKPAMPPLMPLRQAQDLIASTYSAVVPAVDLALGECRSRFAAADVAAPCALPRFDNSAVDGYALRQLPQAAPDATLYRVVGRSAAGHPAAVTLRPGEAVRIFTGAAVPAGADCVAMQEDCRREGERVIVTTALAEGQHIRHAGEDIAAGVALIARGERLTAGKIALAAACGFSMLGVYRRLRVALFSTGDELGEAGKPLAFSQIADSNLPMLLTTLEALGCEVGLAARLPDNAGAQTGQLIQAARDHDLIVTSGGMSVGEEDHMPGVIRRRGHLELWRLAIKPGKPVGIGDIDDCPILALPGNPLAALATLLMIGAPLIARLCGAGSVLPATLRLPLAEALQKKPGRFEARPARLAGDPPGQTVVAPLARSGSGMLGVVAGAGGFILLPEDVQALRAGELVDYLPMPA